MSIRSGFGGRNDTYFCRDGFQTHLYKKTGSKAEADQVGGCFQ